MNYYFVGLLALCVAYAFWAGGAPEKIGTAIYALSVAVTHILLITHVGRWRGIEFGVFTVDVVTFALFCFLAVRANRFWPIWVSALLGLGVLGSLAMMLHPRVIPWAYAVVLSIWSYPILLLIATGTHCHQRRLIRNGADPSWTPSSVPPGPPTPPPGPRL